MKLKISLFKETDAKELSEMIYRVIDEMEKADSELNYTLARQEDRPEELIKASKTGKMWVAKLEDNRTIGTVSLIGDRLRRFFVDPDYQRKGIGRGLIEEVVAYSRRHHVKEIHVYAVLSAVPVYKKLGFKEGEIFLNPEIGQKEMRMKLVL